MVRVEDAASEFDAPLDLIWKFLSDPAHGSAHPNRRGSERKVIGPNTIELSAEASIAGSWVHIQNRISLYPPLGYAVEMVEGPLAGSKYFLYYTPRGDRTGVAIVGDFVSPTLPIAKVAEAANSLLDRAFQEDNEALRKYRAESRP